MGSGAGLVVRRGGALLWAVVGLAIAVAMTPLYVSLSAALTQASARGGHRLLATQRGTRELEAIQAARRAASRDFVVPELPGGRGTVRVVPAAASGVRRVDVTIEWREGDRLARAEWTSLVPW